MGWGETTEGDSWTVGVALLVSGTANATANANIANTQLRTLLEYFMKPPRAKERTCSFDFRFRRSKFPQNQR
jgi:hypothetical protein